MLDISRQVNEGPLCCMKWLASNIPLQLPVIHVPSFFLPRVYVGWWTDPWRHNILKQRIGSSRFIRQSLDGDENSHDPDRESVSYSQKTPQQGTKFQSEAWSFAWLSLLFSIVHLLEWNLFCYHSFFLSGFNSKFENLASRFLYSCFRLTDILFNLPTIPAC